MFATRIKKNCGSLVIVRKNNQFIDFFLTNFNDRKQQQQQRKTINERNKRVKQKFIGVKAPPGIPQSTTMGTKTLHDGIVKTYTQ